MTSSIGIVERMRWMSALIASAVLALVATIALGAADGQLSTSAGTAATLGTAPAPAGSSATLDPRIASLAAHHPSRSIEAIVQFDSGVSAGTAKAETTTAGGRVFAELALIHGLAAKMTASQASSLAMRPDVHSVSLNTKITPQGGPGQGSFSQSGPGLSPPVSSSSLQTTYDQTLGVTGLWRFGVTGAGVGVAVIDTGIDGQLSNFRSRDGSSRVVASAVTNSGATTALDTYGHATDVAGIIAGNSDGGSSSVRGRNRYVGVAPRANLISVKVADENGSATVLNVIYGVQFAVDHQAQYNIRVINLSLDSTTPQSYTTDPLDAAVEAAWQHGITVVAAAGNRGTASDAVQYSPANDPYVITVGATDENGTPNPADDSIPDWSSRGTTQDGVQKPDVYAPGAHIVSVLAPDSVFASACESCVVGGHYIVASGTSLAAPMISGLIADVLQIHADWTPDQVKGVLTSDAVQSNSTGEINAIRVALTRSPTAANLGLTLNSLLGPDGSIDYSLSRWSLSRWSTAPSSLSADFAQASYVCSCITTNPADVDPSLSRWSLSSWSTFAITADHQRTYLNGGDGGVPISGTHRHQRGRKGRA
jgi:serine protease AprX